MKQGRVYLYVAKDGSSYFLGTLCDKDTFCPDANVLVMYLIVNTFARNVHSTTNQLSVLLTHHVTAIIHNTALSASHLKHYSVLKREISTTDFLEYRSLLPFTHNSRQNFFLHIFGIDCLCERDIHYVVISSWHNRNDCNFTLIAN